MKSLRVDHAGRVLGVAVLTFATVVVTVWALAAQGSASRPDSGGGSTTVSQNVTDPPSARGEETSEQLAVEVRPLSTKTKDLMASEGVRIEPSGSEDPASPALTLADALKAAEAAFPGWYDESTLLEASLVSLTLEEYGEELEPDPTKPSRIRPKVEDQAAWVFVFESVPVPLMGAYNPKDPEAELPKVAPSNFIVMIEGTTGEFINARTL